MGGFYSTPTTTLRDLRDLQTSECVVIFSKDSCPYCTLTKRIFRDLDVQFRSIELNNLTNGDEIFGMLAEETGVRTVPRVYVNGVCIGGYTDTSRLRSRGKLRSLVDCCTLNRDYLHGYTPSPTPSEYRGSEPSEYRSRDPSEYRSREPSEYRSRDPSEYRSREPSDRREYYSRSGGDDRE